MELPVIQPSRKAVGQPPIFEKIGIVGLGLIGGSIALAARELWPASLVIAVDNKDVLETAMRGRAYAWYRLRLNLIHVPEAIRPPQEELDPDAAPDDWANLSDDERAAWMAGRAPTRKQRTDPAKEST